MKTNLVQDLDVAAREVARLELQLEAARGRYEEVLQQLGLKTAGGGVGGRGRRRRAEAPTAAGARGKRQTAPHGAAKAALKEFLLSRPNPFTVDDFSAWLVEKHPTLGTTRSNLRGQMSAMTKAGVLKVSGSKRIPGQKGKPATIYHRTPNFKDKLEGEEE